MSSPEERRMIPFFGIGEIEYTPPCRECNFPQISTSGPLGDFLETSPLVGRSERHASYCSFESTQSADPLLLPRPPPHWPTHENFRRLRSSHPLIVRNNQGRTWRSLSWRQFLMVQEAERELEEQNCYLTPPEYFRVHPLCPTWRTKSKFVRFLLVLIFLMALSIGIAFAPALYAAKYLHKNTHDSALEFMRRHPHFVTKALAIGSGSVLLLILAIIGAIFFRRWYKRRALIRAYENLDGPSR